MDCVDAALIEKKRDEWKAKNNLAGKSTNKILTTLGAVFKKQIALRTLRFNPVSVVERLATGSNKVGRNDETDIDTVKVSPAQVYNPDQCHTLLQSAESGWDYAFLATAIMTGARHGELLALMYRDIDFDLKEITIRRNWAYEYQDGEPVFSTPKTKDSTRTIHIPDELCLILKKWKLKSPPSKFDLVFPKSDGYPQNRKTAWSALGAAAKKAKLPRLTVHSLRHSFASVHLMLGTPIPEVSAMLGHANVNITLTIYVHFVPKMQTESSARLAAAIFGSKKVDPDQVGHFLDTFEEKAANETA